MDKINRNNYEAYFLDFAEGNLSDEERKEVLDFIQANPDLREELEEFELIQVPAKNEEPGNWADLKKNYADSQELRDELYFNALEGDLSEEDKEALNKLLERQEYKEEYKLWKSLKLTPSNLKDEWSNLYQIGPDKEITKTNFDHFLIAASEGLLTEEQENQLEKLAAEFPNGKKELELARNLHLQAPKAVFYPDKDKLYRKKERAGLLIWFARSAAVAALFILGYFILGQFQKDSPPQLAEDVKVDSTKTIPSLEKENESNDAATDLGGEEENTGSTGQEEVSKKDNVAPSSKSQSPKKSRIDIEVPKLKPIPVNAIEQKKIRDFGSAIALRTEGIIEIKEKVKQVETVEPNYDDYQTLPELAEDYLASRFDYTETGNRGFVPTMAQKIAERAGEALDAEVKTQENLEDNGSKFTFRVGSFKVTRTSSK
jgi:hypothetical protein